MNCFYSLKELDSYSKSITGNKSIAFAEWDPLRGMRELGFFMNESNNSGHERPPKWRVIWLVIFIIIGGIVGAPIGASYFGPAGFWLGGFVGLIAGGIIGILIIRIVRSMNKRRRQAIPAHRQ